MDPTGTVGTGGTTAATPLRVIPSHTSDLGGPGEAASFVAAPVAVSDDRARSRGWPSLSGRLSSLAIH
jgi:hypothetical protein